MKSLFALLLLTSFTAFGLEAPSAYYVAASILKDSGIEDATHVSGTHVGTERFGSVDQTTHILHFDHGGQSFTCDYVFRASPISFERYAVRAEISGCRSNAGSSLVFNNDYTSENGVVVFERLFFDKNRQFRPLTSEERERFNRNGPTFRDGPSIRLVNPENSNRIILIHEGQMIPIN